MGEYRAVVAWIYSKRGVRGKGEKGKRGNRGQQVGCGRSSLRVG